MIDGGLTVSTIGAAGDAPAVSVYRDYRPRPGCYDEMVDSAGELRPSWQRFAASLDGFGAAGLNQRNEQAHRLLRENGVSYNVHGAPQGLERPWELDIVPMLLARQAWDELAAGLAQRAALLNLILGDIYGPQELLRAGLLPPALVFGHPGFLLPAHQIVPRSRIHLHLYAAHLTRDPAGRWMVLADRTQGPHGTGFALENRLVTSRILAEDFQGLRVERLAAFFMRLRETLQSIAPHRRENPRVVLLSPGPRSPTYFEDTYLARYLGYTLVEGGDLSVRGTTVYLKTLGGLLPVDVLLRRLPDDQCDPLEFQGDSPHGVAGLAQAARSGEVAVANSLGSGLLESPAMMAVLPRLCRRLFGEDLKIPSVPTWWCGREEDLRAVEEQFDDLAVRPVRATRWDRSIFTQELTPGERDALRQNIRRRPGDWVAQQRAVRSTTPVWSDGRLQPWPMGLRAYAVAGLDGRYEVLPGGLARVAPTAEGLQALLAPGQCSKDIWILSDRPVAPVSLLRSSSAALEVRRSANDLPSRVADNLFWLGRHIERAEAMARHLRSIIVRMATELEPSALPQLTVLVKALSAKRPAWADAEMSPEQIAAAMQREVRLLVRDDERAGGFGETLRLLYHAASVIRDRISVDMWRLVNQLDLDSLLGGWPAGSPLADVLPVLNHVLNLLAALSGLATESMTRGPGWRFMDMGRRLERAQDMAHLLKRTLCRSGIEPAQLLEALLEVADSSMTYRNRYLASLQLAPLLDLLLIDDTNPRSIGFQIDALSEHVRALPAAGVDSLRSPESRVIIAAQAAVRLADVEGLAEAESDGELSRLDRFLSLMIEHLSQLYEGVRRSYFTHTGPSRQLGSATPRGGRP